MTLSYPQAKGPAVPLPVPHLPRYGWKPTLWSGLVLLLGVALTWYSATARHQRIQELANLEFTQHVELIERALESEFARPVDIMHGAAGALASLVRAGHEWTPEGFRAYVMARDLEHEFPGVKGLGYVERISYPQASASAAQSPEYRYIVRYAEPAEFNDGLKGLNLADNENHLKAVKRAIETGQPALAGRLALPGTRRTVPELLYLMPVFDSDVLPQTAALRSEHLRGLFLLRLDVVGLLRSAVVTGEGELDFELLEGIRPYADDLLFVSQTAFADRPVVPAAQALEQTRRFFGTRVKYFGGRAFTLRSGSSTLFDNRIDTTTPLLLGLGGGLLTLALTISAWLLLVSRARAETVAAARTADLAQAVREQQISNQRLSQAMRETQSLMDAIDQHSLVSITDLRGIITYVNDRFCTTYGFSREELIGSSHRLVGSSMQSAEYWKTMWATISAGHVWRGVTCNRTKAGVLNWMDTVIMPFFDDQHIAKYVAIRSDITEVKLAQEQLAEQLHFVEVLLESIPIAIYIKDRDGRYLQFNRAFEELFGIERTQWVGKTVFDLVPGPSASVMHAKDQELLTQEGMQTYEASFTRRTTGEVREGLYNKIVLTNAQGDVTGLVGTILDVTERNRVQRELMIAKETAEQATLAKSRFLANMSHEIRTPMNAILGMLKLMQQTDLTDQQIDYAQKTESAARSLLSLINDILDFSKLDAGKMELDPQPFVVEDLFSQLALILSANLLDKPVEVLFDIGSDVPPMLVGDVLRLQQILVNLAGNAIKFTARGEVVVQLQVLQSWPDAVQLRFAVRDSGIGIAPEHQRNIFESFSQAETSTTRKYGGTGLGLSISRHLVTMMGGELGVQSRVGEGSTFAFALRLPLAPSSNPALPLQGMGPLRTLLVDDNPVARQLVTATAQTLGWDVESASGCAQALELARGRTAESWYEVLLIDWEMPDADGWQTIVSLLGKLPSGTRPPIVVMVSAHGRDQLQRRSGVDQAMLHGYLVKPITAAMLFKVVSEARAGKSTTRHRSRDGHARARQLQGMRLLVVEDNLINQQVARELLVSQGAVVSIADNGELAVAALRSNPKGFDAVLMDLQMPVMDGYAATRLIRGELGLTTLPIVAMTANAMDTDRQACLQAGMNEHVGKPFDLPKLVTLLRSIAGFVDAPAGDDRDTSATQPVDARTPVAGQEPELDIEAALERMGGNRALYARSLQAFVTDLTTLPNQLAAHTQRADWDTVGRLLHTVKGLAATLGAPTLSHAARVAETGVKQIREGDLQAIADWPAKQQALVAAVQRSIPDLQSLAARMEDAAPHPFGSVMPSMANTRGESVMPADPWHKLLQDLQQCLRNSDMQAVEYYGQLQRDYGQVLGSALTPLEAAMAQLDFASALQVSTTLSLPTGRAAES